MESEIVTPVCNLLLKGKFPGVDKHVYSEVIAETLVDEAYHIMLSSIAINITRNKKGMQLLSLPEYALKKQMDFCCSKLTEEWQKNIIMLATSVVSELFIIDYLNVLCGAKDIPDFNRQSVESHRRDEMVHNRIFDSVACVVCHNFSQKEKDFFCKCAAKIFQVVC